MSQTTFDVLIAAPPEEVFAYLSDLANAPDWVEELDAVTPDGPGQAGSDEVALGSRYRATVSMAGKQAEGSLEVVLWQPPRSFAYRGEGGPAAFTATFECVPEGAGTRLVQRLELELSGMARFMAPAISKLAESNGRRALDGLKARLEARARG